MSPHNNLERQRLSQKMNHTSWENVASALSSLDQASYLEYVELVLVPLPGESLDPSCPSITYALEGAAEVIQASEEMLAGMLWEKRLGKVRVALCRTRPGRNLRDNRFSWSSDESISKISPRLDELRALDT